MPRRWLRLLSMAAFTAALLVVVALLGQLPMGRTSGKATLRLALRAVQGKGEICRDLTAAELEALPVHMRQPRQCDEVAPPYRLRVRIDMRVVLEETFSPGGLRGDRPLIVDRRVIHAPGKARIQVELEPILDEAAHRALDQAGTGLPTYQFDERIDLPADRITLVLLDEADGRLEIFADPLVGG